jgi:starch synthase
MKILFVASEVAPFAKTGGLADVAGSLPKELKRLGHDVRIILPFYKTVREGGAAITGEAVPVSVPVGAATEQGTIRQTLLGDIPVYLLEHEKFFGREYLYGTPSGDYHDNPHRFAFFCRGVLEFLRGSDFMPDILHCHDWQTALIPIILKHEPDFTAMFSRSAVVFTIHNLAYQGLFPQTSLHEMGLDASYFTIDRLEYYGRINLMKGAILSADLINTVSETYCREIQTPEYGCGLDGVLRVRRDDLSGIINGLDYTEWDPATDRDLFSGFSADTLEEKKTNKLGLQELLGLEQSLQTPLLGIVSRLSAQKGFDLVAKLLPRFVAGGVQLVILGSGEEKYVKLLKNDAGSREHSVSFNFEFDSALAHKIYAGADIFLMPSSYEPCGLGQLIALRYGTIPVVRKTGGLADTVSDPEQSSEPTGFSFSTYSASALWLAVTRALETWRTPALWEGMVRRAMALDFSWHSSAVHYEELYRRGIRKKRKLTHD